MASARKPVFRVKRSRPEYQDQAFVWNELLRSLNPNAQAGEERVGQLHRLMSDIMDHGVHPEGPTLQILQRLGDRWSALILSVLSSGTFRHSELHRIVNVFAQAGDTTPISQRILTLKLRTLERDGLLTRTLWPTVPARADYALTPLGQSLAAWLMELMQWCKTHGALIRATQQDYDRRAAGG